MSNECSQVEILEQALIRKGPSFVLLQVEPDLQVLPMVPPGKANREMI
ncbi:hypothetical protein LEP1GSC116_3510, partial [Leptospira interrogans serovar Icterohaemorrhagiae str. Verdun HP]